MGEFERERERERERWLVTFGKIKKAERVPIG